jgi:hypothetical protein
MWIRPERELILTDEIFSPKRREKREEEGEETGMDTVMNVLVLGAWVSGVCAGVCAVMAVGQWLGKGRPEEYWPNR